MKKNVAQFSDFVPAGQRNVMLLDDNLLSFSDVEHLLVEMIERQYAVNFSQTLDIAYLIPRVYELLLEVDYQNARFTRKRIYFSCNYPGTRRAVYGPKRHAEGVDRAQKNVPTTGSRCSVNWEKHSFATPFDGFRSCKLSPRAAGPRILVKISSGTETKTIQK